MAIPGGNCSNGVCNPGSQDKSFVFIENSWWVLGSTPASLKLLYGQGFLGYIPYDHPASAGSYLYTQRPALQQYQTL